MSYRAFKRLLGETSLERKCRFLFGAGTLLLITTIFWWYARKTEALAYEQTTTTGRLLTSHILGEIHHKEQFDLDKREQLRQALEEFREDNLSEETPGYGYRLLKPNARNRENQPEASYEHRLLADFMSDKYKKEENRVPGLPYYYGAIRASKRCIACHQRPEDKE